MKEVLYRGKVDKKSYNMTNIYTIDCIDYYEKQKKFKIIEVNEIYSSREKAFEAINKSAEKLKTNDYSILSHERDGRHKILYMNKSGEFVTRTYIINTISWNNEDLDKRR